MTRTPNINDIDYSSVFFEATINDAQVASIGRYLVNSVIRPEATPILRQHRTGHIKAPASVYNGQSYETELVNLSKPVQVDISYDSPDYWVPHNSLRYRCVRPNPNTAEQKQTLDILHFVHTSYSNLDFKEPYEDLMSEESEFNRGGRLRLSHDPNGNYTFRIYYAIKDHCWFP